MKEIMLKDIPGYKNYKYDTETGMVRSNAQLNTKTLAWSPNDAVTLCHAGNSKAFTRKAILKMISPETKKESLTTKSKDIDKASYIFVGFTKDNILHRSHTDDLTYGEALAHSSKLVDRDKLHSVVVAKIVARVDTVQSLRLTELN